MFCQMCVYVQACMPAEHTDDESGHGWVGGGCKPVHNPSQLMASFSYSPICPLHSTQVTI